MAPLKNSKGEGYIQSHLKKNNINFETEKTFKDCEDLRCLRFDFYVPNYNLLIEYDGIQHFKSTLRCKFNEFFNILKRDQIKNMYAITNKINLLRIPYNIKSDKIEYIIKETFKEIKENNHIVKFYNKELYDIYKIIE